MRACDQYPTHEWDQSLVVCDQFTDEPFLHLGVATLIRERGLEHGRIGIAGRANVSLHLHELVSAAVPDATLVACDEVIEAAMRPKSDSRADGDTRDGPSGGCHHDRDARRQ